MRVSFRVRLGIAAIASAVLLLAVAYIPFANWLKERRAAEDRALLAYVLGANTDAEIVTKWYKAHVLQGPALLAYGLRMRSTEWAAYLKSREWKHASRVYNLSLFRETGMPNFEQFLEDVWSERTLLVEITQSPSTLYAYVEEREGQSDVFLVVRDADSLMAKWFLRSPGRGVELIRLRLRFILHPSSFTFRASP